MGFALDTIKAGYLYLLCLFIAISFRGGDKRKEGICEDFELRTSFRVAQNGCSFAAQGGILGYGP